MLRKHQVSFEEHPYPYEEHGGTSVSARELGVPEHDVIKTLVMQDEAAKPLIVLMHGDCKVSTKNLARGIGCKSVEPCKPDVAQRHSGYMIGGTLAVRHEEGHARVHGSVDPDFAAHLHQWRTARFPRLAGATGACDLLQAKPVQCALQDKKPPRPVRSGALVYILLRQPRCWCNKHNKGKK